MNINEILSYKQPPVNYYDILGCDQSSSMEQISREYKIRALQLHPDKNPDPSSLENFRRLQTAKDILCDKSSRKSYDCWLNSRIHIPFEQWNQKKGHSMHWATSNSSKLRLEGNAMSGQGSELKSRNSDNSGGKGGDLLEKFRRYEL